MTGTTAFPVSVMTVALIASTALAQPPAGTPPPSPPERSWRLSVANMTRVESWSFFTPPPSGGDPNYSFIGNRVRLTASARWSRVEGTAAVQYVQFADLPQHAVGPGALGTGALYFQHSADSASRGVSLRLFNVRARLLGGVTFQGGRFGYTSGAESPSGVAKVEAVKRARVDSRLVGDFEWSLYQRSFDGVRGDLDRRTWHLTGAWLRPTQGGFENEASASLRDIDVETATLSLRPGVVGRATDVALFVHRYDDDRAVTARPDNSGRTAPRVKVGITTIGASAVGSAERGAGEIDWLAWTAGQRGDWYDQSHGAWSIALEGGYQWRTAWHPWVRAGYLRASGDGNPGDDRHATFFPMLPTVRRYSFTTAYAPMNLQDSFAEVILRPVPRATARADIRRLRLTQASDRWYAGSGATLRDGTYFGYAGRSSGGQRDLGVVMEGATDIAMNRHWSMNGFVGVMHGGSVVQSLFTGRWLRFAYVENVIQF